MFRFEHEAVAVAVLVVDFRGRLVVLHGKDVEADRKATPGTARSIGRLRKLSRQLVPSGRVRRLGGGSFVMEKNPGVHHAEPLFVDEDRIQIHLGDFQVLFCDL